MYPKYMFQLEEITELPIDVKYKAWMSFNFMVKQDYKRLY